MTYITLHVARCFSLFVLKGGLLYKDDSFRKVARDG